MLAGLRPTRVAREWMGRCWRSPRPTFEPISSLQDLNRMSSGSYLPPPVRAVEIQSRTALGSGLRAYGLKPDRAPVAGEIDRSSPLGSRPSITLCGRRAREYKS